MKTIDRTMGACYQGDLCILPVDAIPDGLTEAPAEGEHLVVAHSETGHHHVVARHAARLYVVSAMAAYLRVLRETPIEHLRPWDTHEALSLPPGDYRLLRQREGTPDGWRRVAD